MDASELQPIELMQIVAEFCETHAIHYQVVGSMASMAYGESRLTNDVDIVVDLPLEKVGAFCATFCAPDYYVSEPAVREAIVRRFQFNILHPTSGLKVDVILPPDTEFARSERTRGRRMTSPGEFSAWFASPEDVLLNKLRFYQLGESEKHLRDIAGMLKLMGEKLDRAYIEHWAGKLGVTSTWQMILDRLQERTG